jgi:spoIIIJ-associated protein
VEASEAVASREASVVEASARSVDLAVAQALASLGVGRSEARVVILDAGSPGRVLGFGARKAHVRVSLLSEGEEPDRLDESPVPYRIATDSAGDQAPGEAAAVAETARRILGELLHNMHFDEAHIEVRELEPLTLNVRTPDASDLIGRRGETLRAIQFIVGIMVNKALGQHVRIAIDVDGYRARREVLLRDLAMRFASRVIATGAPVQLEAMPPNERRIIHMTLAEHPDVVTESTGEGDARRIVILPRA